MPVIDLNVGANDKTSALTQCDLCIIGSGPAGATIAKEMGGTNLRVILLESGGFTRNPEIDSLNEIESVGHRRVMDQWEMRNRMVGGSTHTWGGRCGPFDDMDFEERSWVPEARWPIQHAEIEEYYHRSAQHLGLGPGFGFSDDRFWTLAKRKPPEPDIDRALLIPFFWQLARDPAETYPYEYLRIGRHLGEQLDSNVTLVAGATVLQIIPRESGQALQSVEYALPDGQRKLLETSTVVVCGGGIENARLLLSSDSITPGGLGNSNDQVGRYLMDHLRGHVGFFDVAQSAGLSKRFGRSSIQGNLFVSGLRLSPEVQRAEGLVNCSAWLGEWLAEDDPWDAIKRVLSLNPQWPNDVLSIASNAGLILRGLKGHLTGDAGIPRKLKELTLDSMCEQIPNPDSRITLSERTDRLGMRLSRIDWRVHDVESRSVSRMAQLIAEQFQILGLPVPELPSWVLDGEDFPSTWLDVAHPMGSTRMSSDPKKGVVDANCRVHGVEGLYIAGSSVFPTAGHINPTQMIVALAVRLSDHLKARDKAATPIEIQQDGATRKS